MLRTFGAEITFRKPFFFETRYNGGCSSVCILNPPHTMQPEQLGPFRIERVLGRGGMGAVYEGVHSETGEVAAVKMLLSTLEDDDELRLRFEAEIDTLKRLRHPNIVRLYGFGEEHGMLYYVMEMVDGPSLHQEMRKRRAFDWSEAAKIGLEMCSALRHAHDRGITHRDIKPANILLERQGTTKLSDYGIAQLFGCNHLTGVNSVVGTLEYMSPEQALANPVGPRSDLYSLGAVLYALLVGRPPFSAKSLGEILRKHQNNTPDPIRAGRLDVPDGLEAIILDLLKPKQEERPGNAYMVGKRFQSLLQALVGPPEKILVKPMGDNAIQTMPLGPISVPPGGSQEKIGPARGIVTDGGIIDLGGIVHSPQPFETADSVILDKETQVFSTPVEERTDKLLERSFGRPGESVLEPVENDTLRRHEEREHADFLHEEYRRRGIPLPGDVTAHDVRKTVLDERDLPMSSGSENEPADKVLTPPKDSGLKPSAPTIRHGEIVLEAPTGVRRTKDEPLPEREPFEALRRNVDEPVEDSIPEPAHDVAQNQATEWTPPKPLASLPIYDVQQPAAPPTEVSSAPFLEGPPLPGPGKFAGKAGFAKTGSPETNRSEIDDTGKLIRSATRFVTVSEEDLGGFGETSRSKQRVMSLQTILTSLCLVLTGLLIYYLLQPVPAENLFTRIKETIQEDDSGESSHSSLRQAEWDIDTFLSTYSQHPKADVVRDYKEELELADKEQTLRRRQTFVKPSALAPAEWAYLEAVSYSRIDPEKEILKLRAIVDLFGSDAPRTRDERSINRRRSETEQCVELARRRLKKIEAEFVKIQTGAREKLKTRLDDADGLQAENPERAAEIRRGLIELYQDRPWAAEYVERARNDGRP